MALMKHNNNNLHITLFFNLLRHHESNTFFNEKLLQFNLLITERAHNAGFINRISQPVKV